MPTGSLQLGGERARSIFSPLGGAQREDLERGLFSGIDTAASQIGLGAFQHASDVLLMVSGESLLHDRRVYWSSCCEFIGFTAGRTKTATSRRGSITPAIL
jgi:hypothetical protein